MPLRAQFITFHTMLTTTISFLLKATIVHKQLEMVDSVWQSVILNFIESIYALLYLWLCINKNKNKI